jgi:hypothetical protein
MFRKTQDGMAKVDHLFRVIYPFPMGSETVPTIFSDFRFSKVNSKSAPLRVRETGTASKFDGGITWPQESVVILD